MTTLSRSTLVLAALLAVSTASYAANAVEPKNPAKEGAAERQQDKMKRCNAEAGRKELKGDDRRAFMSTCLKG
jgi:hypothetical protein